MGAKTQPFMLLSRQPVEIPVENLPATEILALRLNVSATCVNSLKPATVENFRPNHLLKA
jgi:hypothetical protein